MFGQLTILVAAGLAGPLLSLAAGGAVPAVIGELALGVILGRTGFSLIDPSAQPDPAFRAMGFAMLMLAAGTHVDLGSAAMRRGLSRGLVSFSLVVLLALPVGILIDRAAGVGHPALLAVLIAGSSAAVVVPMLEERSPGGAAAAQLLAWLAVADTLTVLVMPLTLVGSSSLAGAVAGDVAVVAGGVAILVGVTRLRRLREPRQAVRESLRRGWALQLRLSVLLLLLLSTIAERSGASTLVAGFLAGMILARLGEPDRLSLQLTGVANGFFVPIFFVLLGAELNLRSLAGSPSALLLAGALALAPAVTHVAAAAAQRRDRRGLGVGLASSGQLGLPAAAASLGISQHLLPAATAAALVTGACLTIIPAAAGVALLARAEDPTVSA